MYKSKILEKVRKVLVIEKISTFISNRFKKYMFLKIKKSSMILKVSTFQEKTKLKHLPNSHS